MDNIIIYKASENHSKGNSSNVKKPAEKAVKSVDPEYFVKKSNELVEAHYRLTSAEQKFVIAAISLIDKDDEAFKEYIFSVKEILELLGIKDSSYYSRLGARIKSILKKNIELKGETDLFCTWFSSVEVYKQKGNVGVCFDPKLKPYLINLNERFTSYKLKNIGQLRSAASIRIYELLKGIEKTKKQKKEFRVDELRSILGVDDKYKIYSHFKTRVLVKARKELDEKTDISFSFKEKKIGRKVEWIIFFVVMNKQVKGDIATKGRIPDEILSQIPDEKSLSDSMDICNEIYREKGADCLKFYINQVNTAHQILGDELRSYGAYMRKMYGLNKYEEFLKSTPEELRKITITPGEYLQIGNSAWRKVQSDKSVDIEGRIYKEIELKQGISEGSIKKYEKSE